MVCHKFTLIEITTEPHIHLNPALYHSWPIQHNNKLNTTTTLREHYVVCCPWITRNKRNNWSSYQSGSFTLPVFEFCILFVYRWRAV